MGIFASGAALAIFASSFTSTLDRSKILQELGPQINFPSKEEPVNSGGVFPIVSNQIFVNS